LWLLLTPLSLSTSSSFLFQLFFPEYVSATTDIMSYPVKVKEDGGGSESVRASNSFLNLMPCEWNPEFATRRDLDYSTENQPYIEWRAQLGVEDESVVRAFMRRLDEPDVCLPQADKVEKFCYGANLESLQAETRRASEAPLVAWLDERSFEGGIGRSRTYRGPLTAHGLYKELRKPVRCSDPDS
jgi:hypothetical protein